MTLCHTNHYSSVVIHRLVVPSFFYFHKYCWGCYVTLFWFTSIVFKFSLVDEIGTNLILAEEDVLPFVEGSPIISKFGPISRRVKTPVSGASSQPVPIQATYVSYT